jgi:DNA-binding NarL/FixJ family response regulator
VQKKTVEIVSLLGHNKTYITSTLENALAFQKKNSIKLILSEIETSNIISGPKIVEALQKSKHIPVIYISSTSEDHKVNETLSTNPTAVIIKPFNNQQLEIAILIAFNQTKAVEDKNIEQPTPRELEVIEQIAKGLSNKEISEVLFLSEHTIKSHRRNLLKKYSMRTTAELIAISVRNKWININKLGN